MISLLIAISLYGLGDQFYGYNNIGSNYSRMFQYPLYEDAIVESLSETIPENKVFRFPDGQESINNRVKFDDNFTNEFIDFCVRAGINYVILRADFNDVSGSIRTYELLENHPDIEVLYIEASNEPYYGSNLTILNFREWLLSWANVKAYHNIKANQYSDNTRNLLNSFESEGLNIKDKFAFACPVPDIAKYKVWYTVLNSKLGDLKVINFHLYGNPTDPNWLNKKLAALDIVDNKYEKISTEFGYIHFGKNGNTKYTEYAYTEIHKEGHRIMKQRLYDYGFTSLNYHKYMGENADKYFGRVIVNVITGESIDRMKGW